MAASRAISRYTHGVAGSRCNETNENLKDSIHFRCPRLGRALAHRHPDSDPARSLPPPRLHVERVTRFGAIASERRSLECAAPSAIGLRPGIASQAGRAGVVGTSTGSSRRDGWETQRSQNAQTNQTKQQRAGQGAAEIPGRGKIRRARPARFRRDRRRADAQKRRSPREEVVNAVEPVLPTRLKASAPGLGEAAQWISRDGPWNSRTPMAGRK